MFCGTEVMCDEDLTLQGRVEVLKNDSLTHC